MNSARSTSTWIPLSVAGSFGKLVYYGLVDLDPIRCSKAPADKVLYVIKRHLSHDRRYPFRRMIGLASRQFRGPSLP
jgi:hypothetical protein